MAMRRMALALRPRLGRFASGGVLEEEEKAAENMYIKRMERERAEKAQKAKEKAEAAHPHEGAAQLGMADGTPRTEEEASAMRSKGIALAAGIVALGSCAYWYWSSPPTMPKKDEEAAA